MSQVISGVLNKLKAKFPNQIGENRRWSDSYITSLIEHADSAMRERCENDRHSQIIPLVANQAIYDLDSSFINVDAVEYSLNGTDYINYLIPTTYEELDELHYWWRKDRGIRPEFYCLLSVPGLSKSKIHVYRPMAAVTAQNIRVSGFSIPSQFGTAVKSSEAVQNNILVPYVSCIMKAVDDPGTAGMQYLKFRKGCEDLRGQAMNQSAEG